MARRYLAPSLDNLFRELDSRWPRRDRRTDGWYTNSRVSYGHNRNERGLVHAIDVDKDGINGDWVVNNIYKGGNILWYVIWNRRIYSRNTGFRARNYTGSNPHTDHLHIEIMHTVTAEKYKGAWAISGGKSGMGSAPGGSGSGPVGEALDQAWQGAMNHDNRDYRNYFLVTGNRADSVGKAAIGGAALTRNLRR